jgi:hypothetical protein
MVEALLFRRGQTSVRPVARRLWLEWGMKSPYFTGIKSNLPDPSS